MFVSIVMYVCLLYIAIITASYVATYLLIRLQRLQYHITIATDLQIFG